MAGGGVGRNGANGGGGGGERLVSTWLDMLRHRRLGEAEKGEERLRVGTSLSSLTVAPQGQEFHLMAPLSLSHGTAGYLPWKSQNLAQYFLRNCCL